MRRRLWKYAGCWAVGQDYVDVESGRMLSAESVRHEMQEQWSYYRSKAYWAAQMRYGAAAEIEDICDLPKEVQREFEDNALSYLSGYYDGLASREESA